MRLIYLDDSKQEKTTSRFQIIGGVIIKDSDFGFIEQHLGYHWYELVEPFAKGKLEEFHAADILAGNPPFENVKREKALEIFRQGVAVVNALKLPVVFGAVDLTKLYATNYASAKTVDMAFRICVKLVEDWFMAKAPDDTGLLIADNGNSDFNEGKNSNGNKDKSINREISNAFHSYRKKVRSSPVDRGVLAHLHDDMYFGDSKFSKGIQLADLCTLIIGRHLAGYSDTEDIYAELEPCVFKGEVEPR